MSGRGIIGFALTVAVVLGVIWGYNRFSGKSVGDLGKPGK